ncbi:restriction endonuclease subunit S [Aeromonas hydrophila]|uniref:restriction endonuclease subunit S n=1 Tax=Aeromonas hydrophila TaxID=644 RepID=UPI00191DE10C|nr:restriction endonuclease subunit S [Aeromonas hydrophila]MBL0568762.1 restriction endonuclease subunit S [Aeromonas hydrophila]
MNNISLPYGWQWKKLSDMASVDSETLPSSTDPNIEFDYIDISSVSTGNIPEELELYRFSDAPSRARRVVKKFDILMSTVRPNLKAFAMFTGRARLTIASTGFSVISPKNWYDQQYIFSCLLSDFVSAQIAKVAVGSNYPAISSYDVRRLIIPCPPDTIREKISSIFSTIDESISSLSLLIDKSRQVQKGMVVDLLSRGIDPATGQLRPSVHDAPELYNDSPLGPVPKAWSLELLKERLNGHGFIQTGPFGSQLHAYDYVDSGVPVVMPQDLLDGEISTDKISYISPDKAETLSRHKLASNDVIFSRRGDLTRSAFVDSDNGYQGFLCGTGCLLMRVKPEVLCAGWFSNLYGTRLVQAQVDGLAVGTTMANLNSSILGKLLLPFPSVSEQQQIHKRLQAVNSQLKVYISELRKLRAQKAGLMRDLLTGKVPVSA